METLDAVEVPIRRLDDGLLAASLVRAPCPSLRRRPPHRAVPAAGASALVPVHLGPDSGARADLGHAVRTAAESRRAGHLVAVDEVGADPRSSALLALLEPEIVILASGMLTRRADSDVAPTLHAVAAHVERTGAVLVADGVDSPRHRRRALELGATHGLGRLYPPALRAEPAECFPPSPTWSTPDVETPSPYATVASGRVPVRSTEHLLARMTAALEAHAATAGPDTLVLGTFRHVDHFCAPTRSRWSGMAGGVAHAGAYAVGMRAGVESGVVHTPLDPADPLAEEWNVVVLGAHFAGVLSAVGTHDRHPAGDREFDYVVSYDRPTVVRCARSILRRRPSPAARRGTG
ncbi:EAL domain-containing protein [Rhodococcus sp. 14C212]|uniref:DICT sensory domain-containing protein n=1 Tax=Rhodococcus sp. 14C212 TaxID=2711209 RepID=UPI0013EB04D4|nr:EAL domain-containing protein [Rhodococcus sp. 14C212]